MPQSTVAIGDRWTGVNFSVVAGDAADLVAAEGATPWARALESGEDVYVDLDDLSPPVAALAVAQGHAACWVHPVTAPGDDRPLAAITIWRSRPGRPTAFTWQTVRRAGQLLRLTLQWDRSHRSLQYAATHDQLTGLANRVAFLDRLTTVASRHEGRAAVLFLDLDHFKPINENHGHPVGDRVLAIVADRLVGVLRPGDLVARIGGDEFAVLCERLTGADDVEAVAKRLLSAVREPINPQPGDPDRGPDRRQHRRHRPRGRRERRHHPRQRRRGDARGQDDRPRPVGPLRPRLSVLGPGSPVAQSSPGRRSASPASSPAWPGG